MRLLTPRSVDEACSLLAEHGERATPVAGGTDLYVRWPLRTDHDELLLLDLSRLDALRPLRWTDDELVIGALTTYWDVLQDERASREMPLLGEAASQVGAIQIQARGTWGGNVANASPAADGVAALLAYDAVVELVSTEGVEEVPLCDYYLGYKVARRRPDQLIRAIRLPRRPRSRQTFSKVGSRAAQTIAKTGLALARADDGDDGGYRVVAVAMAASVCRCPAVETHLDGNGDASPETLLEVLRRDVQPIDDLRSTARYRERVLANLLASALVE